MEPITKGQNLGDSDQTSRQVQFMGADQWRRLQAIRAKCDPEGMFVGYLTKSSAGLNQNERQAT